MSKRKSKRSNVIDDVQITIDCLTARAGPNLFVRHLRGIDLLPHIDFSTPCAIIPRCLAITELFKQVPCFLFDAMSSPLDPL